MSINETLFKDVPQFVAGINKAVLDIPKNIMPSMIQAGTYISDILDGDRATQQNAYLQNNANWFTRFERLATQAYNSSEALKAYERQVALQNMAQEFNHNEAEINRQWQTQMSNTAYQRAVADMREAGLNPYLAYAQGGAPMSSSQSGSISTSNAPTASVNSSRGSSASVQSTANAITGVISSLASTALGLAKIFS